MERKSTSPSQGAVTRRELFRVGGTTGAAILTGLAAARLPGKAQKTSLPAGRRLAMLVDLDACIGCRACAVACKSENGVRLGGFRTWVAEREAGKYPAVTREFLPLLCNQCEKPPCLDVCPTGATFKRGDGIVGIDKEECIGCRHCMEACPYGARYFSPDSRASSDDQFPARTAGTVDKCDFCPHRVDNGVAPACVNTCPTGARVFGDLADPDGRVARLHATGQAAGLLPRFGTKPKVLYAGGSPGMFGVAATPSSSTGEKG
jgi:tetrathionate reductase subunit B